MNAQTVRSCDVLIVGGGPAGLVLAGLLAQDGVDVVVLERRREPRQYSRAIGLHPPALAVLESLGVEDAACAEGMHVHSGTGYSRGRALGSLTFERAWPDRPFVLTLPQNRTEALLQERLVQLAPGALHLGWEVAEVREDGEEVWATARAMPAVPSPDRLGAGETESVTWRARVLIGADGPRSLVRSSTGIGTRTWNLADTYLMGDFPDTGEGSTAAVHLEPGGVIESFPLPGGSRRWVAHTGTELAEASPAVLARIVRMRTGRVLDVEAATMISAFGVRRRLAERMAQGRSVIIGDAAHEVSPIGGQGMTLGWLDALALAPLLREAVLAGRGSGPLQDISAFRAFERNRLRAARAAARQAELNMVLGRPMTASAAALRDVLLKRVLTTFVRHRLAQAFTMRRPLAGPATQVPQKVR